MRGWRDDFREMADDLREEGGPEAVARLLEHVGDLDGDTMEQLEGGPWKRDLEALDYDELRLVSATLNRLRDRSGDTGRSGYAEGLGRILATVDEELDRRAKERRG